MKQMTMLAAVTLVALGLSAGCGSVPMKTGTNAGQATVYEDPSSAGGRVQGVGMQGNDIISMCDKMMRDMLSNPSLVRPTPARGIVDAEYFKNESSERINKNMLTDKLRTELARAANGRLRFLSRENIAMVEKERELKREGAVDTGTQGLVKKTGGADFRLTGRITSRDSKAANGMISRYTVINFEMIDLETSEILWTNIYEYQKSAQDDVIYR